ncbi:hypothetical protein MFIFM68171_01108 [Madurella fahalii]|uniref:Uncharacterized protein n=1 Tax=Madurella fahalii TaxID=1157608 RepID=A0ABQ0FZK2_9PEZI
MPSIFGKTGSGRAKPGRKSIRGTISGPIPIPSTLGDDEFPIRNPGSPKVPATADDEFPMRRPGTGIATPLPPEEPGAFSQDQDEQSGDRGRQEQQDQQSRDHEDEQSSDSEPGPAVQPAAASSGRTKRADREPGIARSIESGITVPAPQILSAEDLATGALAVEDVAPCKESDEPRAEKKNGTGNQDASTGSGRDSGPLGSAQHRSDPTALSRPTQRSPQRSASLPLSELDRPLRSHSIGPDDIMAIESARNSLQAEVVGPGFGTEAGGRRRAATTTGRMLLRPHLRNQEWGAGLSPRPASAQGRSSRLGGQVDPEDPNEIGRAITSDSGGGLRRRSRSLSGLQDFAGARSAGRRRSDEIRYWRESYDPGFMSPMSSNLQEDIDDTGMVDISAPESPAVERPPKTPPQPFNFGLLSKEMVGMKITHAANMDSRLGNLESRTLTLERVVDQLCHSVPGFKGPLGRQAEFPSLRETRPTFTFTTGTPPPIPAIYHPFSAESKDRPSSSRRSLETDTHSQMSFGDAPTYIGSLRPPSSPATKPQPSSGAVPTVPVLNRPTSTSTVRGAMSMPTMGREAGDAAKDDVSQLRSELEAERAARQALEAQVKKLSDRLNSLSTTMFAMVRGPSESRSSERLAPSVGQPSPRLPPLSKNLLASQRQQQEQLSVFETDDEDEEGAEPQSQSNKKQAGTPGFPSKKDLEEEDLMEDDFQTPREGRTPLTYGAFGEELRPDDDDDDNEGDEDDPKRKKAARTLSLSQLTLGKGQHTRI